MNYFTKMMFRYYFYSGLACMYFGCGYLYVAYRIYCGKLV